MKYFYYYEEFNPFSLATCILVTYRKHFELSGYNSDEIISKRLKESKNILKEN